MSPLNVNLADLVNQLESELPHADALAKVTEAQIRSRTLADLGDQLVGHFVDRARRAGASWSQIGDAIGVSKQAAQQRWVPQIYERFTDRARHVIVLAQEAARVRRHQRMGTEHLLLGLLGEPDGLAAKILVEITGSADAVSGASEARLEPGTENSPARIPFSPNAKDVLEQTLRQSRELGHDFVGTEHILLGLLAVSGCQAATVLAELGVESPAVRDRVVEFFEAHQLSLKQSLPN